MCTPTRIFRPRSSVSEPRPRSRAHWCAVCCTVLAAACGVSAQSESDFDEARERLANVLTKPIFGRTVIETGPVLDAIRTVPRHEFVPESHRNQAYVDAPLPIGHEQTISQPYIVAYMTQLLEPEPSDVALEIGTGSGYQAAVLAEIVEHVYSIEIVPELGRQAEAILNKLSYENIDVRIGDGYKGWPEHAPFDKIIVTAAPDHVPQPLLEQLKPGGRMVIPVGAENQTQELRVITKSAEGEISEDRVELVRFVPMTGEAQNQSEP